MIKKIILKLKLIFIPCLENSYRPKFLESKFLFYYLLFLLILKLFTVSYLIYLPKTIYFADISSTSLIKLTNQGREALGFGPLTENSQLDKAASLKAQDMIAKDYFAHQSPEGKSPWYWIKSANYDYQYAGENLAIGFLDSEEVYQAWNDSPSHKANLFNPNYQDIGITVLKGDFQGNETYVVVQLFGSPKIKPTPKEQPTKIEETPKESLQYPTGQEIIQEKPKIVIEQEVASEEVVNKLEEPISEGYVSFTEDIETENGTKNSFSFNFFQFLSSNYNDIVQKIIFYSLLFIILSLILNIFVKFDIQHKDLIVKTLFFGTLLVLFIFFDKELIIRILPHNFSIY
ncbi:CAP domain-containing protein [Patescibacteria group bacterium]|nr:CAP domain-containing protein [Patescibacteria group bacterium]